MVEDTDSELVARLKRLDASATSVAPGFDYDRMLQRHAAGVDGARNRLRLARGTASVLLVALVGASLWRIDERGPAPTQLTEAAPAAAPASSEPRIVRADSYLAVAALEDHIASLDDALNYARARGGQADVTRLERARAELATSYSQLRYAELVSANY
jgi:hypothetical protein